MVIAAERVGRRCYGLELDPLYVDTIIRRWQSWSGDVAYLPDGREFDTAARDRQDGASFQGNASVSWRAIHSAVGLVVTYTQQSVSSSLWRLDPYSSTPSRLFVLIETAKTPHHISLPGEPGMDWKFASGAFVQCEVRE